MGDVPKSMEAGSHFWRLEMRAGGKSLLPGKEMPGGEVEV